MTSRVFIALRVPADPARAFEAFTREIASWWQPDRLFQITPRGDGELAFEPGVGGRLVTRFANGDTFEIGRISAWEPGRRLVFAWRQASFAPEQSTEVEVRFEPAGEETRIDRAPGLGCDPAGACRPPRLPRARHPAAGRRLVARLAAHAASAAFPVVAQRPISTPTREAARPRAPGTGMCPTAAGRGGAFQRSTASPAERALGKNHAFCPKQRWAGQEPGSSASQ